MTSVPASGLWRQTYFLFRPAGISDLDMLRNRLSPAFHEDRRPREDWRT